MKILFLPRYTEAGPSSRYRIYNYLQYFPNDDITISSFFGNSYLQNKYRRSKVKPAFLFLYFIRRVFVILKFYKYDRIVFEKELIPYFPAVFEFLLSLSKSKKYIVDFDDSIEDHYKYHKSKLVRLLFFKKIPNVMRFSFKVICGSDYLLEKAQCENVSTIKIPTVIDLTRYHVKPFVESDKRIIGWIGSSSTTVNINKIEKSLLVLLENEMTEIHLMGCSKTLLVNSLRDHRRVKIFEWNENQEVDFLNNINIGIMPLEDNNFNKGKCGFKLIQYMACSKPCIASPVGENKIIIEHGINGFLANSDLDWNNYLEMLCRDKGMCEKLGANGRRKVENFYNYDVTQKPFIDFIRS